MILVTLGTQDKGFVRLLKAIDKQIEKGKIKDKVVVQAGYTKYESKNMEIFDSVSPQEFEKWIDKADVVITHGGVGSILTALKHEKKVIAAPRLAKYKEHTNDHQKQIIDEFEKEGYILALRDFNKLDKVLEKSKHLKPKKYVSNQSHFLELISNEIDKNHISWYNRDSKVILTSIINFILFLVIIHFGLYKYLALTICYIISCLLLFLMKNKRFSNMITMICCFYMLEVLLLLLFSNLTIPDLISKLIINFLIIILYHILAKRTN